MHHSALDLASPAFSQASHNDSGGRSKPMMQEKAYRNKEATNDRIIPVVLAKYKATLQTTSMQGRTDQGKVRNTMFPNASPNASPMAEPSSVTDWVGGCNAGHSDLDMRVIKRELTRSSNPFPIHPGVDVNLLIRYIRNTLSL
jgi:hypothetical protein